MEEQNLNLAANNPKLRSRVERVVRVFRDIGFTSHEGIEKAYDHDTDFMDVDGLEDVLAPVAEFLMALPPAMWRATTGMKYYDADEEPEQAA